MRRTPWMLSVATVLALAAPAPATADVGAIDPTLPVWGSVPTPNRGPLANALLGIDVIAADDVWAVGEYNSGVVPTATGRRTLAQHFDGTRWRLVPTPNPSFGGIDFANLEAVSGVAADDVWAVGHGNDFSTLRSRTLIERWDGTSWRIVPSPNPAGPNLPNELFDVLAVSADRVVAVGRQGSPARGLITRFDGTGWRPVANPCGPLAAVTDVPGTSTLWAVGEGTTCRLDGTRWTPVDPAGFPDLEDVSAAPTGEVWAVGFEVACDPLTCYSRSVIQHLQAGAWVEVAHPLVTALNGVYAAAANDVWAVGTTSLGTVVQHWDGTRWSLVPSPDPEDSGELNAIDGLGSDVFWSSGSFFDDEFDQRTLALQAPSTTQGQVVGETNLGQSPVTWVGPVTGSTLTDVFGNYAIPGLPAGRYFVTITYAFGGGCTESAQVTVAVNEATVQDFQVDC